MLKDEAETAMHELVTLARFTSVCFFCSIELSLFCGGFETKLHWLFIRNYITSGKLWIGLNKITRERWQK